MQNCEKCNTANPDSNQYCKSCGMPIGVGKSAIIKKPKLLAPPDTGFKLKYALLLSLVIPGIATVLISGYFYLVVSSDITPILNVTYETGIGDNFSFVLTVTILLIILSFALGGFVVTWMTGKRKFSEEALGSIIVIMLFGFAGSVLTNQVWTAAALLTIPGIIFTITGGFAGRFIKKK